MQDDTPYGFNQNDAERIARAVRAIEKFGDPSLGGGGADRFEKIETVNVVLTGNENGGGYYKGSILYGQSNGGAGLPSDNQQPGHYNFQLQGQTNQTKTDGPKPLLDSHGAPINNALVVNLNEPYVNGSHILYGNTAELYYVRGYYMGATGENPPRSIIYIQSWPIFPCIVKITGVYQSTLGGVYYGRMVQGQFVNGSDFGYNFQLSSLSSAYLPTVDNCWVTNNWEQTYGTQAHNALTVGTYIWGFACGFPQYSAITTGNTDSNNVWWQVYTWFPVQSATLTHAIQTITTGQTANSSYGINEQLMLDNLKTDVINLQASLSNLYANLKSAGYSL